MFTVLHHVLCVWSDPLVLYRFLSLRRLLGTSYRSSVVVGVCDLWYVRCCCGDIACINLPSWCFLILSHLCYFCCSDAVLTVFFCYMFLPTSLLRVHAVPVLFVHLPNFSLLTGCDIVHIPLLCFGFVSSVPNIRCCHSTHSVIWGTISKIRDVLLYLGSLVVDVVSFATPPRLFYWSRVYVFFVVPFFTFLLCTNRPSAHGTSVAISLPVFPLIVRHIHYL